MTLRRLAVIRVAALVPVIRAGVYLSQHRTSGDTETSATPSPRIPLPRARQPRRHR